MILLCTIEGIMNGSEKCDISVYKKFLNPVWEKIRFEHYSLTTEKWAQLHKASPVPDRTGPVVLIIRLLIDAGCN